MPRPPRSEFPELPPPAIAARLARFSATTTSAVLVGGADGRIVWANAAFQRLSGLGVDSVIGRRLRMFPYDVGADDELRDPVLDALARRTPARVDVSVEAEGGRALRLALEIQPIADRTGTVDGFVAVANDVTDLRRSAAELAESEERYRTLVEMSPQPIAVHCEGRVAFVNPAALRLLGASDASEVVGRPILDFVHATFRDVVSERVMKMEASGEPVTLLPEKLLRVDGSEVEVEIAAAPIVWCGRRAIQLAARDVSAQRCAEAERRALEAQAQEAGRRAALEALASGAARDFTGLVERILEGADEVLAALPSGALAAAHVRALRSAALQAAALAKQLHECSGPAKCAAGPVDLSQLVIDLSSEIDQVVSRRVNVSYDLLGQLPPVDGDVLQLREVVMTLLRNAAESLPRRRGRVFVRTDVRVLDAAALASFTPGHELAPGRFVVLEVTDRGCGMDAATRARVFDPFFSTKPPGRGLGLASALGIVRAHGGALRVESERDRGTRVTVALPVVAREGESALETPRSRGEVSRREEPRD